MAGKEKFIADEEAKTQAPDFWDDPKEAEKILKSIQKRKVWTDAFRALDNEKGDAEVLYEMLEAGEADEAEMEQALAHLEKSVEDLEFKNMLSGEEDRLGCMIT
ncbi:MAG: PCRF domain-containing protein, partial [Bacteroidales bacterium]|nr:PCRF domain-containing protein [Bacteroidales bacterium]